MYKLIEGYDQEHTTTVQGRTFPATALVEDDDAVRLLLLQDPSSIRAQVWTKAHSDGASALVSEDADGWMAMTTEDFIEMREEDRREGTYQPPPERWVSTTAVPSYRDIRRVYEGIAADMQGMSLGTFVHLHAHSEYSALDGLSTVVEMVDGAVADDQHAIAVTDHGMCAAHPALNHAATKAGIKPIFGIEANFTDNRLLRGDPAFAKEPDNPLNARFILGDYRHLVMWAETDQGLKNLWAMSTEANITGFYGRPRMDWDVIEKYAEGVMASTACLRGPLATAILDDNEELARQRLGRLQAIFDGRLWIELHTNQLEEQKKVNEALVSLAREAGLPTIAVVDSHYACAEDKHMHTVWIAGHTGKSLTDDADLFAGRQDYHLMTQEEVRRNIAYLGQRVVDESIEQTVAVADRCKATIESRRVMPVFSKTGGAQRDVERLVDICLQSWEKKVVRRQKRPEQEYMDRFEREMRLLIDKDYCGYYLIVWDIVAYAKKNGILVGPGRGSGGGSLVAYLANITEVDPVEADLLFERFLTEGRDSPPDFDLDFPSSKRDFMQDYVTERWGAEYTMRVGTHTRLRNKGVVREVAAVIKDTTDIHWPDIDKVTKIIEAAEASSAGLGISWEDLWDQHEEELEPYRIKYPELFALAAKLVGRLKTYGRHAAGMVIATDEPLTGRLPMRAAESSNQPISEFDMDALELLGLLKFDLLTLRTLDTLQMCLDLIQEHYGVLVNVYDWDDEYNDPEVWEHIADGHTKGIFQIETSDGTRLTKRFAPKDIGDLSDIITLVRPGPKRSGLTETYFRRRAGKEPVILVDERLAEKLEPTEGCIIYQEQVMSACQILGGYSLNEADEIRRILGKKKVEAVQKAGEQFIPRCIERGMTEANVIALWEQLGEFAKYSFNKSHAWCYAIIGYWTAWFKVHFPSMFLTAVLSTVDKDRIPEFVNEARRMGFQVLPPDVNESGKGFRPSGGISVRYGFDSIKGIGDAAVDKIVAAQPYASFEDFTERSKVDKGILGIMARAGCFDTLVPNRRALEGKLGWNSSDDSTRCQHKDERTVGPNGLPCQFDWSSEPVIMGKKGNPLKAKPIPKKCTRACRNYCAPVTPDFESMAPYTEADIRESERELLGIFLSSTPFDRISADDLDECATAEDFEEGGEGMYLTAGIINSVRTRHDRHGHEMAFVTLELRVGTIDVTVFNKSWDKWGRTLTKDQLCFAYIKKTDRGLNLDRYQPLGG